MPIPNFIPVFGTGPNAFSDIGNQQLQWAGFNRGVEEDNLRRRAAAEAAQNEYLQNIARQQQVEQGRADQVALSLSLANQDAIQRNAQELQRRKDRAEDLGIASKNFTESLKFNRERIGESEKLYTAKEKEARKSFAQKVAAQYVASKQTLDDRTREYEDAQKDLAELLAQQGSKNPTLKADTQFFKDLESAKKRELIARQYRDRSVAEHAGLSAQLDNSGLTIKAGKILHPDFGISLDLPGNPIAPASTVATTTGQVYSGFSQPVTNTTTAKAEAPVLKYNVVGFSVED